MTSHQFNLALCIGLFGVLSYLEALFDVLRMTTLPSAVIKIFFERECNLDKIQKVLKNMSPHIDIQGLFFGVWAEENDREIFKPYGRAIWAIDVFLAIEQNIEFLEVEFVSELQSKEMKRACIPRAWLTRRYLDKLCELGIDAFEENANVLFRLLHIQEMAIKKTIRHTSLGFGLINGKLIFKHANAIGIESTYSGQLDIVSKGSYKTWKQMVIDEILGRVELEFALILGLSASLVGFLNQHEATETLLVHICGDSSSGKTTAARLAVSVVGNPSFSGNTLMGTFKSTGNAMTKTVANNQGVPQVFDELSMFVGKFTDLIYTLASGKEKARLNKDSTMKPVETWATTIITTGEQNILGNSNIQQNTGLSVRTLVFNDVAWTQDADHTERIVSIIEKNYGWAILKFAKCLMEYDYQRVSKKLEYWRKRYLEDSTINSNFSNRVSKKYALLLATCSIAKEALELDFSVKRMLRFIVKSEQNTDTEYDIGIKAYELFLQYVEINATYFKDCYKMEWETVIKESRQTYGTLLFHRTPKIVNGVECKKFIIIIATKFMDFCREYGFAEPTVILKNWKRKGLLQSEKDRLVSKYSFGWQSGAKVSCYIVAVINEPEPEMEEVKRKGTKKCKNEK